VGRDSLAVEDIHDLLGAFAIDAAWEDTLHTGRIHRIGDKLCSLYTEIRYPLSVIIYRDGSRDSSSMLN